MKTLFLTLLGVCALALVQPAAAAGKLGVGDAAPALKVGKWIKGDAIAAVEPGKVYVVEFWATWCPPCKKSIPHLTELARRFKDKATVVGVSVSESERSDEARFKAVDSFVKKMGATMDYTVAADTADDFMSKKWMDAAGQQGIPTAFVIGKNGKIAWIGHPMSGLDKAIEKAVAAK